MSKIAQIDTVLDLSADELDADEHRHITRHYIVFDRPEHADVALADALCWFTTLTEFDPLTGTRYMSIRWIDEEPAEERVALIGLHRSNNISVFESHDVPDLPAADHQSLAVLANELDEMFRQRIWNALNCEMREGRLNHSWLLRVDDMSHQLVERYDELGDYCASCDDHRSEDMRYQLERNIRLWVLRLLVFQALDNAFEGGYDETDNEVRYVVSDLCNFDADVQAWLEQCDMTYETREVATYVEEWQALRRKLAAQHILT